MQAGPLNDRVEHALNATRAAVEEGIVPGGGVAYMRARRFLKRPRFPAKSKLGPTSLNVPSKSL